MCSRRHTFATRTRRLRGFTLIEVLTVIVILTILSGIGFVMAEPAREKAREASCMSNLRQIYTALALYSNDNPGPEQLPGLGDIRLLPQIKPILAYTKSHEIFYCPNTTPAMRKKAWSTYQINFLIVKPDVNKKLDHYLDWWKTQLALLGQRAPLVICNLHDETYYAPREQDIDPDLAQAFQIHLQLDGSVAAGRFPGRRFRQFFFDQG